MQFIPNGPDIPERLLQEHVDGNVVFFCGAGISRPAGLPDFADLTQQLVDEFADENDLLSKSEMNVSRFDSAIHLLEKNNLCDRQKIRRKLLDILKPNLMLSNATKTHEALLKLGKTREQSQKKSRMRLVTTNFDRLFAQTIHKKSPAVKSFQAPLVPIPNEVWDGIVHLHGLLMKKPTEEDLDCLVLSSGDFGRAYLTERWAARFVSELFRRYTVCFAGYSLKDPVVRYMTDALAADRLRGERAPEMFAFANYSSGKAQEVENEWKVKNVTPILYCEDDHHSYFHETLHEWGEIYDDREKGNMRIVGRYAGESPIDSAPNNDFVGRMLWALGDPSGLPARHFAEFEPVPSLDWLEPINKRRTFMQPLMSVADAGVQKRGGGKMPQHLAFWLTRHFNHPKSLVWLANEGSQLRNQFSWLFVDRLDELAKDESDRDMGMEPLHPLMRKLWVLLFKGYFRADDHSSSLLNWCNRFRSYGFTENLRQEFQEFLRPYISLHSAAEPADGKEPENVNDLVHWEIALSGGDVRFFLEALNKDGLLTPSLPKILSELVCLLQEALDLIRELEGEIVVGQRYLSSRYKPYIAEHSDNKDAHKWTVLIDLVRDAWLEMAEESPEHAAIEARSWWGKSDLLFRRLALFAAAQDNVIPARLALDWLLEDSGQCFWSVETISEALQLRDVLGAKLKPDEVAKLESVIHDRPSGDGS